MFAKTKDEGVWASGGGCPFGLGGGGSGRGSESGMGSPRDGGREGCDMGGMGATSCGGGGPWGEWGAIGFGASR